MTLTRTITSSFAIVSAAALAATQASAWELNDGGDNAFIYAKAESGASLTLSCSDTMGIQATVYLDGNEVDNLAVGTSRRLATRKVTLDTETTEPRDDRWAYVRSARTLISMEPWQGRRIYNAIVTGSPVTMDVRRVGEYTLKLPPVDDDFKTFSSSCL